MYRKARHSAAALALVFFAACSSSDLGGILGGGTNQGSYSNEIRGVVDYVDSRDQFIQLTNVTGYQSNLSNGGSGSTVRVFYDSRTPVEFQGQNYRPEDLERGDEIAVRVSDSNGRYTASTIAVLRDSSGGSTYGSGSYGSTLRGTVRYVDANRRTIEIEEGAYSNRTRIVEYGSDTYVDYNGRRYRPADLERGDEIEMSVRDLGSGRLVTNAITVTRNASGGSTSSTRSTVRGTVWSVDTSRRTISLDRASWIGSRFDTGSGGSTSNVTVQYETNVPVYYQGRTYAVTNLERGDEIEVEVRSAGSSTLIAERITVVRDSNAF